MDVAGQIEAATRRIEQALGLPRRESRIEARTLARHAYGVDQAWLVAHDRDVPAAASGAAFAAFVDRRAAGEPVAYIIGEREFFGRVFKVSPDVLIPRPDTELLVDAVLSRLPGDVPLRGLDVGTGSGCIALTLALERPCWYVDAMDVSVSALALARENARELGAKVSVFEGDLYQGLGRGTYHFMVSNPPYIPLDDPHPGLGDAAFEPRLALVSGRDGLDALAFLSRAAPRHLEDSGWLFCEHGWDQGDKVLDFMAKSGFQNLECLRDIAGHERVTLGQWISSR